MERFHRGAPGLVAASRLGALTIVGSAASAFGVATVGAAGLVLFGPDAARTLAGRAVPFVVWGNFLAGFVYVFAGVGLVRGRPWARWLAAAIAASTALLGIAFTVHALGGGAFEPRTVAALALRTGAWTAVAAWSARRLPT